MNILGVQRQAPVYQSLDTLTECLNRSAFSSPRECVWEEHVEFAHVISENGADVGAKDKFW